MITDMQTHRHQYTISQ